jgi:para-nitrobenzyl esterase
MPENAAELPSDMTKSDGVTSVSGITPAPTPVRIEHGCVSGSVTSGIESFLGIPYAAPPVGALRWEPPHPPSAWLGVRPAVAFGNDCMQLPLSDDPTPLRTDPSEDCLYLNVWRPAAARAPLPVIVWIHGGGFVNGGSSLATYDGAAFAAHGNVFVSINYRLGRFGFFAHPALSRAPHPAGLGNYGFLDQHAALAWVARNIAAFGGDPQQVTIFGQSCGGESVHMLLTSPQARGLFARAMIDSGGGREGFTPTRTLRAQPHVATASAEQIGAAFARSAGITGEDAAALAALRALPAERLVAGLSLTGLLTSDSATYSGPMVDGTIVTITPEAAYASGAFARVPLLLGATSADGVPAPPTADAAAAAREAAVAVAEPARYVARAFSGAGLPVFLFRFSYVAAAQRAQWPLGAPHGSELPYVFDTVDARYGDALTAADRAVAATVNGLWSRFAQTGDPNGAGPVWPAYTEANDTILDVTTAGTFAPGSDAWRRQLDRAAAGTPA